MNATLFYIYDPMCSWCWGYRPVWQDLQCNLPDHIQVEYIAGGLAPDSNSPMPIEQQQMIKSHWCTIEKKLGTKFNFDFWTNNIPRRSTYNACRAVIAAAKQGFQVPMLEVIQHGYYLRALNPSDSEVLIGLATELAKQNNKSKLAFNLSRFKNDFNSAETQQRLMRQVQLAKELTNQGFPSLVLEYRGFRRQIRLNYKDYQASLADIRSVLAE